MKQEPKKYDDDDGRVIVSMDVEGMPWHDRRASQERKTAQTTPKGDQMSRSEAWRYTLNAILAGLLIVAVFSAGWVLFILFCIYVWFR